MPGFQAQSEKIVKKSIAPSCRRHLFSCMELLINTIAVAITVVAIHHYMTKEIDE
jgi:hypothetical protein